MKYFTPPNSYSEVKGQNPEVCRNGIAIQQTFDEIRQRHNMFRQQLLSILEWSRVDKGLFILLMITPNYIQHFLWYSYVLQRPDADRLVNVSMMHEFLWVQIGLIIIAGGILSLGLYLRQKKSDAVISNIWCSCFSPSRW
jgi:hypothetical protein